ncbi:MAG: hypothetical protein QOD95_20, partial [Gammaproteobacteria bacterium]|nr:hypothetical protein [Gammaproteobacteria bacterium]
IQQQLQRQRSCGSRCIDASADLTNCSARAETCTHSRSDTCACADTAARLAPRNRNQ